MQASAPRPSQPQPYQANSPAPAPFTAPEAPGSGPGPAAPADGRRLADVDALRGFALLGILVVNATYFASVFHGTGIEDPAFTSRTDTVVGWFVSTLLETKFYLLFSFLFGYSFTLQRRAAARRGTRFTASMLRRLAMLAVIGAAHAVLLFTGDILTTYAMLGLILLCLGRLRPRTAVLVAVVLLTLTAAVYAGLGALQAAAGGHGPPDAASITADARSLAGQLTGNPGQVVAAHLRDLPDTAAVLLLFQAPAALAMFLLGLAAGTCNVLAGPLRHCAAARRIQWIGFPVGLAGSVIYTHAGLHGPGTPYEAYALAVDLLTAPALTAAYVVTLLCALHGRCGERLTGVLAPAGRMALSNYLLQSAVLAVVFTGYGLSAVGRLHPPAVLALALALYLIQLRLSAHWMRTHAHGPVEWVLRAVTVLEFPAWRRIAGRHSG
ncbi:DUF418 domain-containing protein [Streptomyces bathyalis]|uniref:DUF418 domain-containing protein n=1 Tax=Streptomyces bathyalis TaxID=2710756 RepID=A0A7T1T9X0_9ACTN|nr:DUF418 domain-containing protein [Streptomyces bathyalis]QPP09080.1 DUF418 domain-containing protein [Streptomyces bathyalis]